MNHPINIEEFIKRAGDFPVIDVRSPGEYLHGHIPGAHNIPLFDNEERAIIGTLYKQAGRLKAIEKGFELVGPKLSSFILNSKTIAGSSTTLLVHCWRGGMRSANFAHLLNVYGFRTFTLIKGYKSYRNQVLQSFGQALKLCIVGGETGSGKSDTLREVKKCGEQVIDLERLANHKGSAFGALGEDPQPTQEQFENLLSDEIRKLDLSKRIWVEDESHSIGRCYIPNPVWNCMKQAPILRMQVPKNDRIARLVSGYGKFPKEELARCIGNIEKRLGPQHAKHALQELEQGNLEMVADITLTYYDKAYHHDHEKRQMKDVHPIECPGADPAHNAKKLIEFADHQLKKMYA